MPALLSQLALRLPNAELRGGDVELLDAVHIGSSAREGHLFCAVPGRRHDGHDHAGEAVRRGASALLVERWLDHDIAQLRVPSVRVAMGPAAAAIHGDPADGLLLLGVTGTNGKTTVTSLLEAIVARAGMGSGRIGTLGARLHGRDEAGVHTTPEGTDLQRLLRSMRTRGADAVSMEVSSHGLDLRRVDGMRFDVVAFTNLTQDHLDWHGDLPAYLAAKARLFTPSLARQAVVLVDAPGAPELLERVEVPVTTVGSRGGVDVEVHDRRVGREGSSVGLRIDGADVVVRTIMRGDHNLDNAVVAVVTAVRAGIDAAIAVQAVADTPAPPGRLEAVGEAGDPLVLVDYAHTPDAVSIITTVGRGLVDGPGRLIVVLGAGGDRDRDKRGPMGQAAASADLVIVTDDNPRDEDPASIRRAVIAGARLGTARVEEIPGRSDAVHRAVADAAPGDVVLVLGRGHEPQQELAGRRIPLDDRVLTRAALESWRTASPWTSGPGARS